MIVNPKKIDELRLMIDEEVSRMSIDKDISRTEAYVEIASEPGYAIRAFTGNEGWSCVVALSRPDAIDEVVSRMFAKLHGELAPLEAEIDRLAQSIDAELESLSDDVDTLPSSLARDRIDRVKAQMAEQQKLRKCADRLWRRYVKEFAKAVGDELRQAIVVFGVSYEIGIIAAILRMLDPSCDALLNKSEACSLYTRQDIRRRSGSLRPRILAESKDQIALLDSKAPELLKILDLGLANLIDEFLGEPEWSS